MDNTVMSVLAGIADNPEYEIVDTLRRYWYAIVIVLEVAHNEFIVTHIASDQTPVIC